MRDDIIRSLLTDFAIETPKARIEAVALLKIVQHQN